METKGRVFKYPDNVDTDVIIPARYLNSSDAQELAKHCIEHAPLVIKTCGTGCVIAKSFARIFYRNAINIGLPILECPEAAEEISDGDEVQVNFDTGVISDLTTGKSYQAQPFPPFIQNIIKKGGLLAALKER